MKPKLKTPGPMTAPNGPLQNGQDSAIAMVSPTIVQLAVIVRIASQSRLSAAPVMFSSYETVS